MILIDAPAPRPKPVSLDLICPELGTSNLIALTPAEPGYYSEMQGTLSIKCTFGADESYIVDGARLRVGDGRYLILNEGQRYASEVDRGRVGESLCVFFRPGFAEELLRSLVTPDDELLSEPEIGSAPQLYFIEKSYRGDGIISPVLTRIHERLRRRIFTRGWLEEQFHDLLPRMLRAHRDVNAEIARIPAVRRATRIELLRRLERGRDFIASSFTERIALADMAREANMAPHHFLRLFKKTFGSTPHQYLTSLRLEEARHLLRVTDRSIAQICIDLGFESPTSFSLLFRRHVGVAPSEYREMKGEG